MGRRVRMSAVDTAWLRMDSAGNLMVIVGVYQFVQRIDRARLRHLLLTRLACHFRLRARVAYDTAGVFWEEVDRFDIDRHLVTIKLPGAGSESDLKRLTAQLAAKPFDPLRPLWQFHLVENYQGGDALIVRIHHCIADGIALIGVMLALTSDDASEDADSADANVGDTAAAAEGPWDPVLKPFVRWTTRAIGASGDVASRVLQRSAAVIDEPQTAVTVAAGVARLAVQVTRDAASIALMDDDSATSLKGAPSGNKAVAWNDVLPLDEVKSVCKALGCSVNDVLVACVAGALRRYLLAQGEAVEGSELRAMVPVNLRSASSWRELGNKFGLVPLLLPVGIENPLARVIEVRRRMDELKQSTTPVLAMMVLGAAGMAPKLLQKQTIDYLASKATMVLTNVPGPQQPLYMAGAEIKRMLFWVPQSGDIALGVSVLSYNGGVQFGLIADRAVCEDPQRIIDEFAPEFERLVLALCMLPWDEEVDPQQAEELLFAAPAGAIAKPAPDRRQRRKPRSAAARAKKTAAA